LNLKYTKISSSSSSAIAVPNTEMSQQLWVAMFSVYNALAESPTELNEF